MGSSGADANAISAGVNAVMNLLALVAAIIFGINGNSWREKHLLSRGFDLVDTISAANAEGAVALYMKGTSH